MTAYCGINCSECRNYIATKSGKYGELEKVAAELEKRYLTEVKPEYVICDGCRTERRHSFFCRNLCKMRQCCIDRNYKSCIECSNFPCKELELEIKDKPQAKENLAKMRK